MKQSNALLIIAGLLILVGLGKFDLSKINILPNKPAVVDVMELSVPSDESILKEAKDVVKIVKDQMTKEEARKLRDLCLDLGQLIKLDGEDQVIKNTEEIRQANSIAGSMLKLDIKGKYPDLAQETKEVIIAAIGDDNIVLSPDLRVKCVDGFNALAWAFNEGSK
jgi:siroheme synthase (precorrin-2 oxidase/ferrochelatase)